GCSYEDAAKTLKRAGGSVKTAVVMVLKGVPKREAVRLLDRAGGFVRRALEEAKP
ncbi:unnamed protein product, partial [marine sediment metagenome]